MDACADPRPVDPCHVDPRPVDPCLVDHCATRRTKKIRRWPGFPGPRLNETIGAGYFVFRRGDRTGRIENRGIPFEHPTLAAAVIEAKRLRRLTGGYFDVVCLAASLYGDDLPPSPTSEGGANA